jgi:putative holliday junction resolvase
VLGRILAIDFGLKRMGLAVSDALGLTAQGLPTLARTGRQDDLHYIRQLAEDYSVVRVLVGNPLSQGGEETTMSRRVAAFATGLRQRLRCPVELWDERLTSVEAGRMLRSSGISIEKRRGAVDRVAAILLLQSYLDRQAFEKERASNKGENT